MTSVYERLESRLPVAETPTLAALPDGSVDRYCSLAAGESHPLESRGRFAHEMREGATKSFRRRTTAVEPGGQATNAAQQMHALGAVTTLYGHLSHPVFSLLPFETVSMGDPAVVDVVQFDDGDLLFVEPSADIDDWALDDFEAAVDGPREALDVDGVCWANWSSLSGAGAALRELAEWDGDGAFVFDPGDVGGVSDLAELGAALAALGDARDVVISANRTEVRTLAAALSESAPTDRGRLVALRDALGVRATVLHGEAEAVAATPDGVVRVRNPEVVDPVRHTGGGDRFSGGLTYALALDWEWDLALALGNVCASRYVATGETGDAEAMRAFAREKG